MSAPSHVPSPSIDNARVYRSPDHVPSGTAKVRPGALPGGQPAGQDLGHQGPDQGYVLRLRRHFDDRLILGEGEHLADAHGVCTRIALKRASIFGRAPVIHDLEIAYQVWGLLNDNCDPHLAAMRAGNFEGAAERHHYADVLRLVATVPESTLRMSPAEVETLHLADWRSLLDLDALAGSES
ncbi:MAG: hypothetical protein ACI8Y4_002892 [Candidatus Poriferisodalaceae bacterium]|jgi:hypothetical protein